MTDASFAAMKCAVRVRLPRFKGECIAALTLGRRTGRTHAADAGGSGLACLHGRITAAMSCLSTVRDARALGAVTATSANVNSAAAEAANVVEFRFIFSSFVCLQLAQQSPAGESQGAVSR